jgi:hypothetical protein
VIRKVNQSIVDVITNITQTYWQAIPDSADECEDSSFSTPRRSNRSSQREIKAVEIYSPSKQAARVHHTHGTQHILQHHPY